MIDRGFRDETQARLAEPLPVDNILIHDSRFQLLLCGKVEDLDGPSLRLESDDVFEPVHNSTVRGNWALDDFIIVFQVDDNDLGLIIFAEFLSDAHIVV